MYQTPFQLCHCMNVFPGTTLREKAVLFEKNLPKLRSLTPNAASEPFAAGLWFDADSASYLMKTGKSADFAKFAQSHDIVAFTANAFPYGSFHGTRVKRSVYLPDWTTRERVEYTNAVADILFHFLPENMNGSVSTLPGAYRENFDPARLPQLAKNMLETAEHLRKIHFKTGKMIRLAVEMEPDCLWESPEEFIAFYDEFLRERELSEYIGVCYDTCHQELLGTEPCAGLKRLVDAGIRIPKIQCSAAISAPDANAKKDLAEFFNDPVYLHQTRSFADGRILRRWADLPDALTAASEDRLPWKTHFHVPVFTEELSPSLRTAKDELKAILAYLQINPWVCDSLEIETYSYHVLPDFAKSSSLEESMAKETVYLLRQLKHFNL